jgi:homogentisate 1,2-dioxygenase
MSDLRYQTGIGNQFESEALPGALPQGRNSPQRVPMGLYAELLSGSAFTAPRAENRRTWMYRRRPSVGAGPCEPLDARDAEDRCRRGRADPAGPAALACAAGARDPVAGLRRRPAHHGRQRRRRCAVGIAVHLALANRSMQRAFVNADGELLVVPQQGRLHVTTELGGLEVRPGEIAAAAARPGVPVAVDGPTRAYVCENYGAPFRLPELGPIGSNGLANPRDFLAPVAAFDADPRPTELVRKSGGRLWRTTTAGSPFNVVAWHGNLVPFKYDTARFMTLGSISFDHPDPSIFTVLTSPSDTPGVANCDFVIFPPRWMVAEDTFRPPWYHRNVMSEFMGLVYGQYDAKPEGFRPAA